MRKALAGPAPDRKSFPSGPDSIPGEARLVFDFESASESLGLLGPSDLSFPRVLGCVSLATLAESRA